jgi:hypothetical protein
MVRNVWIWHVMISTTAPSRDSLSTDGLSQTISSQEKSYGRILIWLQHLPGRHIFLLSGSVTDLTYYTDNSRTLRDYSRNHKLLLDGRIKSASNSFVVRDFCWYYCVVMMYSTTSYMPCSSILGPNRQGYVTIIETYIEAKLLHPLQV